MFYTAQEIADILKCKPGFVYKNRKVLGGVKICGLVRFPKEFIDNMIGGLNGNKPTPRGIPGGDLPTGKEDLPEQSLSERTGRQTSRKGISGGDSRDKYGLYQALHQSTRRIGNKEE